MNTFRILFSFLLFYWSQLVIADFKDGGNAYMRGDYETAVKEFAPLAEKGDHRAMYALGSMYAAGLGVEKNLKKSYELFREAALNGRSDAMHKLGMMYELGLGVEQNLKKAARMYQKSATKGYPLGQYRLGLMYSDGNGIKQNINNGYAWLVVAGHYFIFDLARMNIEDDDNSTTDHKHQLLLFQQQEKDKILNDIINKLQQLKTNLSKNDIEIIKARVVKYSKYRNQYKITDFDNVELSSDIENLFLPETLH